MPVWYVSTLQNQPNTEHIVNTDNSKNKGQLLQDYKLRLGAS